MLTSNGIAYDRAGPTGARPVVLLHAGVADRGMWQPQWRSLTADRDVLRLDLRGFGGSTAPPDGPLCPAEDVLATLDEVGIERCHLVGASFGAGVAVEVAVLRPDLVASLLLAAPGGALMTEMTPDLRTFFDAERAALDSGDLDAAVEANLRAWVDGPGGAPDRVNPLVRAEVARMQRRAFEVTADWADVDEVELDPAAVDRLAEIGAPTLVLAGALDLQAITVTASSVAAGIARTRTVIWPDAAHLPSMEHPQRFLSLVRDWLDHNES